MAGWYENKLRELGLLKGDTLFIRVGMLLRCPTLYLASDRVDSIMYRGIEIHEIAQTIGRKLGYLPEYEVRLELGDKLVLVGHIDLLHPETHTLVEVKTTRDPEKKVYNEYLLQVSIYKWMLEKLSGEQWHPYILLVHDVSLFNDKLRPDIEVALLTATKHPVWTIEYSTVNLVAPTTTNPEKLVQEKTSLYYKQFRRNKTLPRIPGKYCEWCPLKDKCSEYLNPSEHSI